MSTFEFSKLTPHASRRSNAELQRLLQDAIQFFVVHGGKRLLTELIDQRLTVILENQRSDSKTESINSEYLSVNECCDLLKVKRTTLYNLTKRKSGFPSPIRFGKRILYNRNSVLDFLERRPKISRYLP